MRWKAPGSGAAGRRAGGAGGGGGPTAALTSPPRSLPPESDGPGAPASSLPAASVCLVTPSLSVKPGASVNKASSLLTAGGFGETADSISQLPSREGGRTDPAGTLGARQEDAAADMRPWPPASCQCGWRPAACDPPQGLGARSPSAGDPLPFLLHGPSMPRAGQRPPWGSGAAADQHVGSPAPPRHPRWPVLQGRLPSRHRLLPL